MSSNRSPHLRVLTTPNCNLKCPYCRPGGEGYWGEQDILLNAYQIQEIVKICSNIWCKNVKVSGGEPFLRDDLPDILEAVVSVKGLKTIQLVTNGVLLQTHYSKIADIDFTGITISLDTIDRKKYKVITGKDALERVLKGIQIVKEYNRHPITINCVVTKQNVDEVEQMIRFTREIGATLKLIDFMKINSSLKLKWEDLFVDFSLLSTYFEKNLNMKYIGIEEPVGGLGTPQLSFETQDGTKVLLRDAQVGTNYHESCKQCKFYPCHDALISMRITHNGHIKRCLIRDDNLVNIRTPLEEGNIEKVSELIYQSYSILSNSEYWPHKWSPQLEYQRATRFQEDNA